MSRKGFTLVELLVVISIVGLLSTIAVVSLSTVRKQSRNTKRNADVKQLVTAFSLGLDAGGTYPSTGGDAWKCISTACTNYLSSNTVDAFFQPFMPNKPTDPNDGNSRGNSGYVYNGASAAAGNLPTIVYFLEPPATCSVGVAYVTNANYVECLANLY